MPNVMTRNNENNNRFVILERHGFHVVTRRELLPLPQGRLV